MTFAGLSRRAVLAGLIAFAAPVTLWAQDAQQALDRWLAVQTPLKYWSAKVDQRRELSGIARPLTAPGRVWITQPDRLRWELGEPPRTIAIRKGDELLVHYPRLEQTERYALSGEVNPAGQQALALLEVGFPSDAETFKRAYKLLSGALSDGAWVLTLEPTAAGSQRLLDQVRLWITAESWQLQATEFAFPDGSRMHNAFSEQDTLSAPDPALYRLPDTPQ